MTDETKVEEVKPAEVPKKIYPPSASAGGDNAFYLRGCDIVQRSPSYSSCLWKISEHEAGRTHPLHADCIPSIANKTCAAIHMRNEELLKGEALFYFPRQFIQNQIITNLTLPDEIPRMPGKRRVIDVVTKSAPKEAPTAADREFDTPAPEEDSYAAAINAEMKKLAETPAALAPKVVAPAPAPKVVAALAVNATPPELKTLIASRPVVMMLPNESPLQYARRVAASR